MALPTIIILSFSLMVGTLTIAPWLMFFIHLLFRSIFRQGGEPKLSNKLSITNPVSVIVPFNGEWDLIENCLKSINSQDYQGNIKTFVVSNTANLISLKKLIQELHLSESKFQAIGSEYEEKSFKLNLCIQKVETPFIAFLDADHIAEPEWITSSLELLNENSSWSGLQSVRKPILKKGIVYAWDSFINHVGNEFLNKIRAASNLSIPFTGTSAVFRIDCFKTCLFENSMTEDTDWYFRMKFLQGGESFQIGYGSQYGSRELMASDIRTLISRRIRWATGHTKSFTSLYKKSKWRNVKSYSDLFHGLYFTTSLPFVFFILINLFFFYLQMNPSVKTAVIISSVAMALIFKFLKLVQYFKYWISILFSYIIIIFFALILSGFSNIGLDVVISKYGLVMLPGSRLILGTGALSYFLFLLGAIVSMRYSIPASYQLKAIIFSVFYIPIEVATSFYGVFNSFTTKEGKWRTLRNNRQGYYEKASITFIIISIVSSFWLLLDHRDITSFSKDLTAFLSKKIYSKKIIPFNRNEQIRGIAISSPPSKMMIDKFSEIGVNAFRYYKDPGAKWINQAYEMGIYSIIQPSFSNWDHVDVRIPWSRWYLTWNLFYLDSKYRDNPAVPFIVLGNEIELWAISEEKNNQDRMILQETFFEKFREIQNELKIASHYFSNASTIIDLNTTSPFLMPNMLTTSPQFWEQNMRSLSKTGKLLIAGEWGGFQAPDENPPDWLRSYRTERQWSFLEKNNFSGGFFFASSDNSSQPRMLSFNDPLDDNDPEDTRGALDSDYSPKEIFWNLAFVYSPFKVFKEGHDYYLKNTSRRAYKNVYIHPGDLKIDLFSPGDRVLITNTINAIPKEDRYAEYLNNNGIKQKILFFHYPGRLTGCLSNIKSSELVKDSVYIANFENIDQVQVSHADIHFSGKSKQIEIHPKQKNWHVTGIKSDSLKLLFKCRKPFYIDNNKVN